MENEVQVCLESELCQSVKNHVCPVPQKEDALYLVLLSFVIMDEFNYPHLSQRHRGKIL